MKFKKTMIIIVLIFLTLFLLWSCAANNEMYFLEAAGFWAGLWHGLIIMVTFIISLFTHSVGIYEASNSGSWYNFGFVLGSTIALGHGGFWHPLKQKKQPKSEKEIEWEEISVKVEEKMRAGIQKWLNESSDDKQTEWKEIAEKVEEKIKRELKKWAEK